MARILGVFTLVLFLSIGIYSASKMKFEVLSYKCVGCADCIDVCPKDAITLKEVKLLLIPKNVMDAVSVFIYVLFLHYAPMKVVKK